MLYNIYFETAAAAYMVIIYAFLHIQYTTQSEANRQFRRLTLYLLLADILDVITAITISYGDSVWRWANIGLNTVHFTTDALMGYQLLRYVASYVREDEKKVQWKFSRVWHGLYLCLLAVNLFTGIIFDFDAEGHYLHGPAYLLVYLMPFYYIACSVWILVRSRHLFLRKQRICIGAFLTIGTMGPILQLLFFQDVLLSIFSLTLGILMILFTLETPDYQKLMQTMDELERIKEEAEDANHAKDEFLAHMSHEIRTPINAILGYNEMIAREALMPEVLSYTDNVQAAGRSLLSSMSNILDFASITAGRLTLNEKPYETFSLLNDVVTYAEYLARQKDLMFHFSVAEQLPQRLVGDSARLLQILNNLISNAVKYTQQGAIDINIGWSDADTEYGMLDVIVSDSGIGMKQEDIERISRGFERFDSRKTQNIEGIGLGIAIVTRLLEKMGSALEIRSTYGSGSVFSFRVRQQVAEAEPIGAWEERKVLSRMPRMEDTTEYYAPEARILTVDDNTMNLDLFRGILKNMEMQIDTALDGKEALVLLEKNEYDMVFLDHMMPVMDGMETLHEIRRRGLCHGVPIIVLTANAVEGVRESYLAEGFTDYLSKPVSGKLLEEIVREYLPEELLLKRQHMNMEELRELLGEEPGREVDNNRLLEMLAEFLDTATGMAYCGDSEDFYVEMLKSYLENDRYESMQQYYAAEDWENYRIQVHALKSTSLTIGALHVSDEARRLEMAAKDGNYNYIRECHSLVMDKYRAVMADLRDVVPN